MTSGAALALGMLSEDQRHAFAAKLFQVLAPCGSGKKLKHCCLNE
jgi:uncharacterized protein YchJ